MEINKMQMISATDLARNTRDILNRVVSRGEVVAIARNHVLVATIVPAKPTMTASQALAGWKCMLTPTQATAWLKDSVGDFEQSAHDPWE